MDRDPRLNPVVGDVIEQYKTGLRIRVIKVSGEFVSWEEFRVSRNSDKELIAGYNAWSISGWLNVVAKDSVVIQASD